MGAVEERSGSVSSHGRVGRAKRRTHLAAGQLTVIDLLDQVAHILGRLCVWEDDASRAGIERACQCGRIASWHAHKDH
jgi:hypothetical protein